MPQQNIDQEQMVLALFELEAFFDRMPSVRMILLRQTAQAIKEGLFFDPPLTVGLTKADLTKEVRTTIEQFLPEIQHTKYGYSGEFNGVPVHVYVIEKSYDFIYRSGGV